MMVQLKEEEILKKKKCSFLLPMIKWNSNNNNNNNKFRDREIEKIHIIQICQMLHIKRNPNNNDTIIILYL